MLPDPGWNCRNLRKPFCQRFEVKTRAPHNDWELPFGGGLVQVKGQILKPKSRGVSLAGWPEPVKAVRCRGFVLGRRPVRYNAQLGINLHGIRVDDDAAKFLGQFQGERGLAAGGRACDKNGGSWYCIQILHHR